MGWWRPYSPSRRETSWSPTLIFSAGGRPEKSGARRTQYSERLFAASCDPNNKRNIGYLFQGETDDSIVHFAAD